MKRRSVSVTGATGFLGWALAEGFRDAGWQVRAVVRPGNRKPVPAGVETVESPIGANASPRLVHAFQGSSVVVHSAALTRARYESTFADVNVEGTRAVVEASNEAGAGLIFISSQAVAGPAGISRPAVEDDEPRPINAYARSKLEAERAVRSAARVPWTILRPSAVYGPRDRQFLQLFRLASRGYSLAVADPSTPFTLIHVDDVVRAVLLTADAGDAAAGQTLFLGHATAATVEDILSSFARAFGKPYRPWRVPSPVLSAAARLGELEWMMGRQPLIDRDRLRELRAGGFVCSVERARTVIGFTANIALAEGVARTAAWYRDQAWI